MKTDSETNKPMQSYLTFRLNSGTFAVEIEKVVEILEVPHVTHIPRALSYMKGVFNLRGQVLPLIDTCLKFGLPEIILQKDTCIIIIEMSNGDKNIRFGALADQVLGVLEHEEGTMQASPGIEASYNMDFIKGVIPMQEEFVIVLDIEKTFSVHEIQQIRKSTSAELSEVE